MAWVNAMAALLKKADVKNLVEMSGGGLGYQSALAM